MIKRKQGRSQKRFTTQEALSRFVYTTYRSVARKRRRAFPLTREEFTALILMNCHYCDSPPSNEMRRKAYGQAVLRYQGIDRKDNARGYEHDNVVPCCERCNRIKGTELSYEEMITASQALAQMRSLQPPSPNRGAPEEQAQLLTMLRARAKRRRGFSSD